jgi:epoxide hydrolase-like predicted phosphatase
MANIKAVVFDIGGVLKIVKHHHKKYKDNELLCIHEYMAKKYNLDIDTWFDSIDSPYGKSMEGLISSEETISIISNNLKTTPEKLAKLWINAYKKKMKDNKELYNFAIKLKKKGYKIAILSDQWHLSKKSLVKKEYLKYFNPIIISCDIGMRKPNPNIFILLIKKLKLKPKEIVFIEDREWNIQPAKKLGINTILFKNNKQTIEKLRELGVN